MNERIWLFYKRLILFGYRKLKLLIRIAVKNELPSQILIFTKSIFEVRNSCNIIGVSQSVLGGLKERTLICFFGAVLCFYSMFYAISTDRALHLGLQKKGYLYIMYVF